MTRISYAQNMEDIMLWRATAEVEAGFYIDIGAQSPDIDSVSRFFYENGWRGIHVEPMAEYAAQLRAARPDETVIEAAAAEHRGTLTFYAMSDTGLSTLDPIIADQHRASGFAVTETTVPVITLDDIFADVTAPAVHWLKIDVEGAERLVLLGWKTSTVRPWVVVVESTLPLADKQSFDSWDPLILDKGYRFVYFDGLNRYYVSDERADLADRFKVPPNVFDGFALSCTPSTPFRERFAVYVHEHEQASAAREQAANGHRFMLEKSLSEANTALDWRREQVEQFETMVIQGRVEAAALKQSLATAEAHAAAVNERLAAANEQLASTQLALATAEGSLSSVSALAALRATQIERALGEARALQLEVERTEGRRWEEAQSAHRWWQEADRLRAELEAVYRSHSWRLTAYLRSARRFFGPRRLLGRLKYHAKHTSRAVLVKGMKSGVSRPAVRRVLRPLLRAVPPLHRRLVAVHMQAEEEADAFRHYSVSSDAAQRTGTHAVLSPRASMVLSDIKQAIAERTK